VVTLKVNGQTHEVEVKSNRTLMEVLRETLGLMGTHEGCNRGDCGACTVLVDGQNVISCLMLAGEAEGRDILTIEGMGQDGRLHPLQQAFIDYSAFQCGYCTPGFLLSAKALLDRNPRPTVAQIKEGISGHLCRCTGYTRIVQAIHSVAERGV